MPKRRLAAARIYITAAWIDHPAAAGIDHLKAAAVIGNPGFTAFFLTFAVRFTDIGFFFGHDTTSFGPCTPHRVT
jgi:hypothetical protein